MAPATESDDSKELLRLCRTGRLYDVEKWILEGKPLDIPGSKKQTLLQVAVETEFHSLVGLVAKHETSQASKNAALADAVSMRRLDFVELLADNGADVASVPLADVLLGWEPKIIRFFLDHGADPVAGSPFAEAFGAKVRTALRPFLECKQARPDLAAALQEQADSPPPFLLQGRPEMGKPAALGRRGRPVARTEPGRRTHRRSGGLYVGAERGQLRRKCRCAEETQAGSRPRQSRRPASLRRRVGQQGCARLSARSWGKSERQAKWRLFRVGHLVVAPEFWRFPLLPQQAARSKYEVSKGLDCVRELVAHGAVWNPNDRSGLNSLRRTLYECEPAVTIELLQMFQKHNACPADRLRELLRTPG